MNKDLEYRTENVTRRGFLRKGARAFGALAGLAYVGGISPLVGCEPTVYQTESPECLTGMVEKNDSKRFFLSGDGAPAEMVTHHYTKIRTTNNKLITLYDYLFPEGSEVEVCAYARPGWLKEQVETSGVLWPKMKEWGTIYRIEAYEKGKPRDSAVTGKRALWERLFDILENTETAEKRAMGHPSFLY